MHYLEGVISIFLKASLIQHDRYDIITGLDRTTWECPSHVGYINIISSAGTQEDIVDPCAVSEVITSTAMG